MVELKLENITKRFDSPPVTAVEPTNLSIEHGEFFTLVGPSGCGKTTMLRMIAGLEKPSGGDIYFDGVKVTDLTPQQRDIAMVFQNVALYPHMSVRQNIGYGLKVRGDTDEMEEKVESAAELLNIKDQLDKDPSQLSGGQQQRVALGRAIVRKPNVILFDEPMSDLDAKLKSDLRVVIQELHQELDTTLVYVTHDQKEAMTMSTVVGLLNDGSFEQVSPPNQIYDSPETEFAATFIGQPGMNVFDATVTDAGLLEFVNNSTTKRQIDISEHVQTAKHGELRGQTLRAGFRPQHITLTDDITDSLLSFTVRLVEQDGNLFNIYAMTETDEEMVVVLHEKPTFTEDDTMGIEEVKRLYLFDPHSGSKILQLNASEYTSAIPNV